MYTLNLDVVKRVERDIDSSSVFDELLELGLVLAFDLGEASYEVGVRSLVGELLESIKVGDPLVHRAYSVADELRQARVAAVQPTARSNTISLVLDLARIQAVELREDSSTKKLSVECSHSVDCVGAHDGEERHADLLLVALLDEGHAGDLLIVAGVLSLDSLEEVVVDKVNQFHMARQKLLQESDGPLLESLRQHGVIRVGEGVVDDVPGLTVVKLLFIKEDSEELHS